MYTESQGTRVVTNGMLAYLLFQHWGNRPERFVQAGTPEQQALAAAAWNNGAHPAVTVPDRPLLGVPSAAAVPDPFPAGGISLRILADPGDLRYDLTLGPADGLPLRLVMMDERTARAFAQQTPGAHRGGGAGRHVAGPGGNDGDTPTLLVAPAPVLGLYVTEHHIPAGLCPDRQGRGGGRL